jgi:choline/glycine/proline betaine transport protein
MLFSAGMGIGIVFYGVAEPITHFSTPPDAEPRSAQAARDAMEATFFHWGVHAWAIYAVLGLAYFGYRTTGQRAVACGAADPDRGGRVLAQPAERHRQPPSQASGSQLHPHESHNRA